MKMPEIDLVFLLNLRDKYTDYPNFIETGTFYGRTIFGVEPYFSTLHTIEILEKFYENAKKVYKGSKIQFHLGDSSHVLTELLPTISDKSIIFLDGHWSAGDTGRGNVDVPLYNELHNIMLYHKNEAIVIIDDFRLFGKGPSFGNEIVNWENMNLNDVLQVVKDRMKTHYFLPSFLSPTDRLVIHLDKLS